MENRSQFCRIDLSEPLDTPGHVKVMADFGKGAVGAVLMGGTGEEQGNAPAPSFSLWRSQSVHC